MRLFTLPPWIVFKELPNWTCTYLVVHICNFSQKLSKLLKFSLWVSTKHPSKNATRSHDMPRRNEYNQPGLQKWWFFISVGWFFEIIKNSWFWFFENFRIKESSTPVFRRKFRIKEPLVPVISEELLELAAFMKELKVLWLIIWPFTYFEKHGYIPKSVLCIFLRTQQVNVFIPRLTTNGHLSLILRTAQH